MVIRTPKKTTTTAKRTSAPVKKRVAPAAPAKKTVPAKRTVPAQRKATPAPAAKRTVPAKKSAPAPAKAAPVKRPAPVAKPAAPAVQKAAPVALSTSNVTSYDVLRAKKVYEELEAAFWASQAAAIDGAAEHVSKAAEAIEKDVPKKTGRPSTKEGPARKAVASEPVIDEYYDIDLVKGYTIVELRELANMLADKGIITERKIKGVIYEQMEAAGLFREDGSADADEDAEDEYEDGEEGEEDFDDDDDDETEAADSADDDADDEEADGGDGSDDLSLDDLKKYDLKQLQDLAEEWGIRWKNLTQEELLTAIIEAGTEGSEDAEDSEDEEFEDEDDSEEYEDETAEEEDEEDDSEEEDEEEYEEMELTEEDINAMGVDQLLEILEQVQVRVPAKSKNNATALRELLLAALEEQDTEEE